MKHINEHRVVTGGIVLKKKRRRRFSFILWGAILLFIMTVLSFPQWITFFYPQPHRDTVILASYENQIDPYLVFAIIRAESKYQSQAESSAGARGLMQLMPDTAQWIADKKGIKDFEITQLHEPNLNINFGCWYLANLSQEFDGRIPMVIAAYNAGRGNVKEWIISEQWDGDPSKIESIPFPETRNYVKNVLKNYEAYRAIYQ